MSIPYNAQLSWEHYCCNPDWHQGIPVPINNSDDQLSRAVNELCVQTLKQTVVRSVQFIRDGARLVLKVPIRALCKPIFLEKNWKEYERAKINAKLTGYSFVHLVSVPVKFLVALAALVTLAVSLEKAKWLLDQSESYTGFLDGRASQLEALKEEGRPNVANRGEFNKYKAWLYSIDPRLCR